MWRNGLRRGGGYLCVFHAVACPRICRTESAALLGKLFPCVCEIGRVAARWGALCRGASRSLCNVQHSHALPLHTVTGFYIVFISRVTNATLFLQCSDRKWIYFWWAEAVACPLRPKVGTPPLETTVGAHLLELCGESSCLILLTGLSDVPQVLVTLPCCLHWMCGIKWWPHPCRMLGQTVTLVGTGRQTAKYFGSPM